MQRKPLVVVGDDEDTPFHPPPPNRRVSRKQTPPARVGTEERQAAQLAKSLRDGADKGLLERLGAVEEWGMSSTPASLSNSSVQALISLGKVVELFPRKCRRCGAGEHQFRPTRSFRDDRGLIVVHGAEECLLFRRGRSECRCCAETAAAPGEPRPRGMHNWVDVSFDDVNAASGGQVVALQDLRGSSRPGRWGTLVTLEYAKVVGDLRRRQTLCTLGCGYCYCDLCPKPKKCK